MDSYAVAASILTLFAGIGVFLIACKMMSENLETLGSDKLRELFAGAGKSKLLGVGIGTVGTAAIQSSGATTVMVIGFVNAGVMTLAQAATIVFGANIGTTITAHIVALGLIGANTVSTTAIFSALTCLGALIESRAKHDGLRTVGGIITGFGMLFIGLSMMSGSMEGFAQLDSVHDFLASIESHLLLVVVGAVLTAIIQSSSVMTSVAITMLVAGLITLDQGIFLTMGSNIGSCVVSVIASLTSGANAKRTAAIHLLFNIGGVLLFSAIGQAIVLASAGAVSLGSIFHDAFPNAPQTQLAMFHTVFNVIAVIVALPLTEAIVALVTRLIPDGRDEAGQDDERLSYFDENMLATPAIAVAQIKNEILSMADLALENFQLSLKIATTKQFDERDRFARNEDHLDFLNRELVRFMAKLSNEKLSEADYTYLSKAFHTVSDLERVGDYAQNIVEHAEELESVGESFTQDEIAEIEQAGALVGELFSHARQAYIDNDRDQLKAAFDVEDKVDELAERMGENYIQRFAAGLCTPETGTMYLSLSTDAERAADHFVNMAKTIQSLG